MNNYSKKESESYHVSANWKKYQIVLSGPSIGIRHQED